MKFKYREEMGEERCSMCLLSLNLVLPGRRCSLKLKFNILQNTLICFQAELRSPSNESGSCPSPAIFVLPESECACFPQNVRTIPF